MHMIPKRLGAVIVGAAMLVTAGGVVSAQELSPSHIEAAERAAAAAPSLGNFDQLLPAISEQTQNRLIRQRPDLFREIAAIVEAQAKALAQRRNELDNQIARIWARSFSEEELNQVADFFGSEAGQKYIEIAPSIGEDLIRAGRSWANRLADELYELSIEG